MHDMIKHTVSLLAGIILAVACSIDKGNYEYVSLHEPVISDVAEELSVLTQEVLHISPSLGGDFPEDEYEYLWRAVSMSDDRTVVTLSDRKVLDYLVELPAGSYRLLFKLTQRSNGVYWQHESKLTVNESTSEGWMVLCEEDGRTRLDFISSVTSRTYHDILSRKDIAGPRKIFWSYYADASSPFYLLTDDGATRLGRNGFAFEEEYRLDYEMGSASSTPVPQTLVDGTASKLMIADGKLFYAECLTSIGLFGEVSPELNFAPYVGTNILTRQVMVPAFLLYDTVGKRFMGYAPGLIIPQLGAYNPMQEMNDLVHLLREEMDNGGAVTGSAFETFPQGMDLVWMENTKYDPNSTSMGMTYALLKDSDRYCLYGVQLGELYGMASSISACAYAVGRAYYSELDGCSGIEDAECFAFSSLRSKMYYSVGGKVYGVDLSARPLRSRLEINLPGETVTCLKFQQFTKASNARRSYDLVIGSDREGEGTLRIYEGFDSDGDFSSVKPVVYSGLGSIVDVSYRELLN